MVAPIQPSPTSIPSSYQAAATKLPVPTGKSSDSYERSSDRPFQKSLPATSGNRTKLLVGADQVLPEAVAMIDGAKTLVQLDLFLLGGNSGGKVADALIKKMQASKGAVQVQLMVDPSEGTIGQLHQDMMATVARLEAAGAQVRTYPMNTLRSNGNPLQNISRVDHAKLMDVDGERMLIGSMNLCSAGEINRDLMVRIDGPAAVQENQIMNRDWSLSGAAPTPLTPQPPTTGDSTVELTVTSGDRQDTRARLIKAINDAKTSINVGMYQFDDRKVADALIAAGKRGVQVRVLLCKDDQYAKYAPVIGNLINGMPNQAMATELENAGLQVKLYVPRTPQEELHAKYTVIDGQLAIVGSTNFTEKSFTIYRDSEAFIQNEDLAKDLDTRMFEDDWQNHSARFEMPGFIGRARNGLINLMRDTKLAEW